MEQIQPQRRTDSFNINCKYSVLQILNKQIHQHMYNESSEHPQILQPIASNKFFTSIQSMAFYNKQTRQQFKTIFQHSENLLKIKEQLFQVNRLRQIIQNKVYNINQGDLNSYLSQIQMLNSDQSLQVSSLCLQRVNQSVFNRIISENYQIKKQKTNLIGIKKQLDQSYNQLNKNLNQIKLTSSQINVYVKDYQKIKKQKEVFQKVKKFRQKDFWNNQQKSKSVSHFLAKINSDKRKTQQRYKRNMQKSLSQIEDHMKKQKQEKIQKIKQKVKLNMNVYKKDKQRQHKQKQYMKKKQQQVLKFLSNYKGQKSIQQKYKQYFEQNIIKPQMQDYQNKLKQIHQARSVIPMEQLLQHRQKFQQVIKLRSKIKQKNMKKEALQQKIQEKKLNQLYHSRHHKKIVEQQNYVPPDERLLKNQRKIKRISYSQEVYKNHKPIIDQTKKQQIFNRNRLIKKKKSKGNNSQINSQVQNEFLNQNQNQTDQIQTSPREKGLQYLQYLRLQNQGKKRKDKYIKKNCKGEGKKIYDRSLQKTDYFKIKSSLSQWKSVLTKQYIQKKQKKQIIESYSIKLNLQKKKLQEQKRNTEQDVKKQIQLNQAIQKCYIQQAKSKLQLLKL